MKILAARFSSIGDIVLTSPAIRCLSRQTNATIHFLTKSRFYPVVEGNPYISRIFTIEEKVTEVIDQLREENYDVVLDLHKNLRTLHLRLLLRKPFVSFDKINLQKWLAVHVSKRFLPRQHIVHRYMEGIEKLGVEYDGEGMDYFIPPGEEIDLSLLPVQLPFIGYSIGGSRETKKMPVEQIAEVCSILDKQVILLGGPEDAEAGEYITRMAGNHVFNGCGMWTINQSSSVAGQAEVLISHDTGLMHIGAALKVKIVSVWGNTVPEFGMFPFYPDGMQGQFNVVEVNGLRCRPCSKIGYPECPKGHFACMRLISTDHVVQAVEALIDN